MKKFYFVRAVLALGLSLALLPTSHAIEVTVYNDNLGLVKDVRSFELKKGESELRLTDVPSQIDATSVHFKSLTDPGRTTVLEQNYQYDLISQEKLLEKYLGRDIQMEAYRGPNGEKKEVMKGTLLSSTGGQVLKVGNQIYLNPPGNPVLPELPDGLVTKPTLLWRIQAEKSGTHACEITYMTAGMSWKADYVVVLNDKDDRMDLNSWVTLTNTSGGSFKEARLKLIAGDVNRVEEPSSRYRAKTMRAMETLAEAEPQFQEKSFFEYHLYTLGRATTIQDNETKQIELAKASDVSVRKKYIYDGVQGLWTFAPDSYISDAGYGLQSDKKVWVKLEFKNSKANNLGLPLPKGRIRVFKKDEGEGLEFIGEDQIDHTAKDETLRLKLGQVFDVVGERKRTDFQTSSKTMRESFAITLRNHKEEDVTVNVLEHLYRWSNWKIEAKSHDFKKTDAQTIEFEVPVPKNGETTVTYTVKYWW